MQPDLPRPPITPSRPDTSTSEPGRSRKRAIWIGAAIGLTIAIGVAIVALLGDGDGFPDRLDGLTRVRSSQADVFEASLGEFALGDVRLTGAMYGETEAQPLVVVQRIDGPSDEVAFIPLEPTFDGAIFGFENSGGGDVNEATTIRETRSGFEIMCAEVRVTSNPMLPEGEATMCGWKAETIGFVFDFRGSDLTQAADRTARIADVLDG
jgi:hypothetical protein